MARMRCVGCLFCASVLGGVLYVVCCTSRCCVLCVDVLCALWLHQTYFVVVVQLVLRSVLVLRDVAKEQKKKAKRRWREGMKGNGSINTAVHETAAT